MRRRHPQSAERAVSVVIGTVLLLAIVVILMSILASAVLGVDFLDRSPSADIVYEEDENGTVLIALADARGLSADNTEIRLRTEGTCRTWDGSGTLGKGDAMLLEGSDCPESLEEGDVLQVIGAQTLLDTYELRGRYPDYDCEEFEDEFNDGSLITIENGGVVSCDFTDDGSQLDNGLEVDNATTIIGNVNVRDNAQLRDGSMIDGSVRAGSSKDVILQDDGDASIVSGDIIGGRNADIDGGGTIEGSVTVSKSVWVRESGEVEGTIEAGEDVLLDRDAIVGDAITLTGSSRLVEVDNATVRGSVYADDNDVLLKGDGIIEGDVTADTVECKDDSEIHGDINADDVNGC